MGDWFGIGQTVGSIGSSLIGGLFSSRNTDKTNQKNLEMTREANEANLEAVAATNATNKAIADQNLGFQQQSLEYQKALNQQIMEREDTAYQRTVDDMRAAGLSPLSIQGTNGSGGVVSAPDALHNDFQAQTGQVQAGHVDSNAQNLMAMANMIGSAVGNIANIDQLRAQAKKTNAEADAQLIENKYRDALLSADLTGRNIANFHSEADYNQKVRKNQFNETFGIVDGMTDMERRALMVMKTLGIDSSDNSGRAFSANGKVYNESNFNNFNPQTFANYVNALQVASGVKDLVQFFK